MEVFIMCGELGMKIKKIEIIGESSINGNPIAYEMKLVDQNGEFLYIVGNNNLPQLLNEALNDLNKKISSK
jgi:hypothetical protein